MTNEQKKKLASKTYSDFENGTAFKQSISLLKDITRSVLFENGKQWNMDADIAEFPKITLNIIKQIGKARKSNVMQNEYGYLVNSTNFQSVRKIQDFLKYLSGSINLKAKDLKALSDDYTKGTAIGYFYWDAEKRGFLRKSGGEMRYEVIDIRNFVVANPYIQSIQEQEWVMFVTRERISSLKKKYGQSVNLAADGNLYTSGTETEPASMDSEEDLVNVYTKFYRNEDGEVVFVITTKDVLLKEPTALNIYYKSKKLEAQPNTTSLPDEKGSRMSSAVWNLYPFARLCLNERDNCFYGLPVTLEYIETQKSINNHFSVYDKALQDNVLGGFVYRKDVLDSAEITTENGQMIPLNTMPNEPIANAFGRLPVANVPADSHNYSTHLVQMARETAGASNVQLGMSDFAGQSGKQTQMLLQRAQENASDMAMMFNEFKREQAYIMFLFAKFYYDNENFTVIEHGFQTDNVRNYADKDAFDGTEYVEDDVQIDIKVGAAPSFSEYTNVEMLGLMVQSGQAPFEAYISMLPEGYISNKQELIDMTKKNSLLQIKQLQQQIEQMKQIMEQMAKAYKETEKDRANIDTIVRENEQLHSMLADMAAKTIEKSLDGTEKTQMLTDDIQKLLQIMLRNKKA